MSMTDREFLFLLLGGCRAAISAGKTLDAEDLLPMIEKQLAEGAPSKPPAHTGPAMHMMSR